jgi:hypothetical protein
VARPAKMVGECRPPASRSKNSNRCHGVTFPSGFRLFVVVKNKSRQKIVSPYFMVKKIYGAKTLACCSILSYHGMQVDTIKQIQPPFPDCFFDTPCR